MAVKTEERMTTLFVH